MDEVISVIVPFYNAERYIRKCLESIRLQNYMSFECIMVNDGSRDKSIQIAEEYASKDERFVLINQPNAGVSKARNTGINAASGKYIFFIDSDDYIECHALMDLWLIINELDCDIAMSDIYIEHNKEAYVPHSHAKGKVSKDDALVSLYNDTWMRPVVWGKLYKKEIFDKYQFFFDPDIFYSEDTLFITEVLLRVEDIAYSNVPAYHYYVDNNSSALHSLCDNPIFNAKCLTRWKAFEKMEKELLNNNSLKKKVIDEFRASRVEAARDMINLEYRYDQYSITEFKEQLRYERKYLPIYLLVRKRNIISKALTVLNAISPRIECRVERLKNEHR